MNLTPDSWGGSKVKEFNPCHEPAGASTGGQFCRTGAGGRLAAPDPGRVMVGVTSARKPDDLEHYRPNRVVAEQMHALDVNLRRLPGVRRVEVKPALGQWGTGSEFSFAVAYSGNGQARRLLAEFGKQWNQDGVLILRRLKQGETPDAAYEMLFERPVGMGERAKLASQMTTLGFAGWTWFKQNGKTVLRLACVPQWGGNNEQHRAATMKLSSLLSRAGHGLRVRELRVKAEVLERDTYDTVITGGP